MSSYDFKAGDIGVHKTGNPLWLCSFQHNMSIARFLFMQVTLLTINVCSSCSLNKTNSDFLKLNFSKPLTGHKALSSTSAISKHISRRFLFCSALTI